MSDEEWDFWDSSGMHCGGYNSAIDADLISVFIESRTDTPGAKFYSSEIAQRLGLAENYVELLKYALCSADFCDYGTSPRGAWAHHGREAELLAKLTKWYERRWNEVFTHSANTASKQEQEQKAAVHRGIALG